MVELRFPDRLAEPQFLGRGGFGDVYRARWEGDARIAPRGTLVAVKAFRDPADDGFRRMLRRREFFLSTAAAHPNLVRFYEISGPPDEPFPMVVMEYMAGGTLRGKLEDFRSPRAAVRLAEQLARGLAHLHAASLVHRDLKPENVLFASEELKPDELMSGNFTVKIVDFDLIREIGDVATASRAVGSLDYRSPEQTGEIRADIGLASDIYSLGIVIYEALTGRMPASADEWRPSRFNRAVRGNLDQIVLGCLQQNPERRYTAVGLQEALSKFEYDCARAKAFPNGPPIRPAEYDGFDCGPMKLDLALILGGDAVHRYRHPHGIETTLDLADAHELPHDLADATEDWLRWREADAERRNAPFENRRQPRVRSVGARLSEGRDERLYPLRLRLGVTDYFSTQCTNFGIQLLLPDRRTIREKYAGRHDDFGRSQLADPLATNFSVVTCGGGVKTIFMSKRGKLVGGNAEFDDSNRVPAVSGTGHPLHDRDPNTGSFCPFRAGIREAQEEVLGNRKIEFDEVCFFGFARTGLYMFPFLFGEIRLDDMTADDFKRQRIIHRNDVIGKDWRPFTIESVTAWMKELYYRRDKNGRIASRFSHTGILSLYQSLIYEFPDEIDQIHDLLKE